jgi:peptidase M1-like protein
MPRWLLIVVLVACSSRDRAAIVPPLATKAPAKLAAPGLRLPDGIAPLAYDLRLEVDPEADGFTGHLEARVLVSAPTDHVWIHADELTITKARWDGGSLAQLPVDGDQMIAFGFGRTVGPGEVTLAFDYTGRTAHDEEGLFRQHVGDHWYLFSQGEPTFARRIAPCFDEPRWKTPWRVTLVVPGAQVALANMPAMHEQVLADGRRELAFAETPPIPSYLLAIAVGPFELVDAGTAGRAQLRVRVAALAGERDRVGVVAQRVPAIVDALEGYLDEPLPWPKLDLVVVPHLFGAMENPGLLTFDARVIVGDARSPAFTAEFVHVAAHELAHQWFGNLVTPSWWDDLWLSEAFASWLGERTVDTLGRSADGKLEQATARARALEMDSGPTATPLRRKVIANDDPASSFDETAYDKGQAVLATFERWAGEDAFRTAVRAYLHAHRGGSTSSEDFMGALAAAASPEIAHALDGYVGHAGVPIADLALDCTAAPKLVGHARDGLAIPMCLRVAGAAAPVCALVGDRTELPLASCPAWAQPTGGYYVIAWTSARPADPPHAQLAPADRVALGDDIAAAVRRGELPAVDAIPELRAVAGADLATAIAAMSIARAIDPLVAEVDRPAWTRWLAARFAARLQPATLFQRGELAGRLADELVELVGGERLAAATVARARELLAAELALHGTPEPDVIAAAGGDRTLFTRIAKLAGADPGWSPEALAAFGPELAPAAVELALGPIPSSVTTYVVASYLQRGATRTAAWAAVRDRLPELLAHIASSDAATLLDATGAQCDATARAEIVAAFEPALDRIPDGRGHEGRALARIDRCIAARARAGDLPGALK